MIQVLRQGRSWVLPLWRAEVEACAAAMLEAAGMPGVGVELLLAGDSELAELNQRHLGLCGPTNVLSFVDAEGEENEAGGEDENEGEVESLGLAAVSVEAVQRESMLFGQDPLDHLARLLAHGLLHLMGHEHGEFMEDETERLLEAGRPFLT